MDGRLRPGSEAVAQFEADARRAVEAEEVGKEVPGVPLADRAREPVRQPERELAGGHPQGRRERGER